MLIICQLTTPLFGSLTSVEVHFLKGRNCMFADKFVRVSVFLVCAMMILTALTACSGATASAPPTPSEANTTAPPTPAPTRDAALIARGQQVYVNSGCTACHAIQGVGTQGAVGPALDKIATLAARRISSDEYTKAVTAPPATTAEQYVLEAIVNPNAFVPIDCPTGPCMPGIMPNNYNQAIREGDITALVAYLLTLE